MPRKTPSPASTSCSTRSSPRFSTSRSHCRTRPMRSPNSTCSPAGPCSHANGITASPFLTRATCSKSPRAAIPSSSNAPRPRRYARTRRQRGVRAERHAPRLRRRPDRAPHRPKYGGQIDLHPASRAHHVARTDRLLGAGEIVPCRPRRSDFLARRRQRRSRARQLDLHGRDERDR